MHVLLLINQNITYASRWQVTAVRAKDLFRPDVRFLSLPHTLILLLRSSGPPMCNEEANDKQIIVVKVH